MRSHLIFALVAFAAFTVRGEGYVNFIGSPFSTQSFPAEPSSGLEGIYVLSSTDGVKMQFQSSTAVTVSSFGNRGAAYPSTIGTFGPGEISVPLQDGDMGYILEEGSKVTYLWVVDYSAHELKLESLRLSEEQDCARARLDFVGHAEAIPYYTINGRRLTLSRHLYVEYSTLAFDEDSYIYTPSIAEEIIDGIETTFSIPAPLCNTTMNLSGDRFLRAWGKELSIDSDEYHTISVAAETRATQTPHTADNEQKDNNDGLGGSAPCEIEFEAAVSDAAIFREWQISRDPEFNILDNSYSDLTFTYTFTEQGTSYVRFTADNADGTCPFEGPVYEIFIGESRLDIPNAFSPQSSPGVNDEWKVSYKSLVSFECHIFNRWGKELFKTNDPAIGWDGKSGGKYVPAGVYYYVIKAKGSDGIDYKRAGDINIIDFKQETNTSTQE